MTQIKTNRGVKAHGVLTLSGDSTLHLTPMSQIHKGRLVVNPVILNYAVKDVYSLRFRKKSAAGKGSIIGGGLGFLIGSAMGYFAPNVSSYPILDERGSVVLGGVLGTAVGAGLGALAGGSSYKITLYGDLETYNQQRNKLDQFVMKVSVQQ